LLTATALVEVRNSRFGSKIVFAATGVLAFAVAWAALAGLPNLENLFAGMSRTGQSGEILTLTTRTEIWEVVWTKICEKPLFGWGFNGTEKLITDSFDKSFYGATVNAHNAFLHSILSVGFIGSLPAFAFMILLIYRFVTRPDPTRDQIVLYSAVLGIAEVDFFGVPTLLTLAFVWLLVREGAKRLPFVTESFDLARNNPHTTCGLVDL